MRRSKRKIRQRGGVLSTMVGNPLVYSNVNSWPSGHNGGYYSNNQYPNDMQTSNIISGRDNMYGGYTYTSNRKKGGRKRTYKNKSRKNSSRKRRRHFFRGGFPLLNDVRLGSEVVGNNLQNIINTSTGNPSLVSPLPYMNQFNRNI